MGLIDEIKAEQSEGKISLIDEIKTQEPSFYKKWVKPIAEPTVEALGLIGGGIVGAGVGLAGAPIGAGLGYAGAKQLYRTVEELAGISEPKPLKEQLIRTGKETATGAAIEAGGQVAGKVIAGGITKGKELLSKPFQKKVIPEVLEAEKALQEVTGIKFSPSQKTESGFIDIVENVAEKSLAGAPRFTAFRAQQEAAIGKFADDIVDKTWSAYGSKLSKEQTGQLFKGVVDKKIDVFESAVSGLYKNVDNLSKGVQVNLTSLKNWGTTLLETAKARKGIGASKMGDTLIRKISMLPDTVDFSTAQSIRTGVGKEIKAMEYTRDVSSGIAKKSYELLSNQMRADAARLAPDAKTAFDQATTFYKQGYEKFHNKFMSRMLQKVSENPEVIVDYLKNSKTGDIRKILNISDESTKQALKTSYIENIITTSSNADGVVLGNSFLTKLRGIGTDKLNTIFTGNEIQTLNNLGIAAKTIQKKVSGTGGMMIQLTQWGPILSLPTSIITGQLGYAAAGGGLLIGTHQLAKIMTHPVYSKWFAEGLKTSATSPKAVELGAKLLGISTMFKKNKEGD